MSATTNGEEISVSTANGYINTFIQEYFTTGKSPVKSLIMDADLLRGYLQNSNIQNVKFMLGARDVPATGGGTKQVLTLVVAGYDANGNYVLTSSNNVLDHMTPCPTLCPTVGNAANDNIS